MSTAESLDALRNFFQETSEPCRSVAKKIFGMLSLPLDQHFPDLALEAGDVAPHDVLGAIGVGGQDRLQQLNMLVHRLAQAHLTVDHEVPEPQAQVEVALERRFEERVARGAVDGAVDAPVH